MSTRCNILLKAGNDIVQLYHHFDGYWEGVGEDLVKYMTTRFTPRKETYSDLDFLVEVGTDLEQYDDVYELEDEINLHGDIEYLYVVDLDSNTIHCLKKWDETDLYKFTMDVCKGEVPALKTAKI